MFHVDRMIHAPWIITGNPHQPLLENHSLILEKDKIRDILPTDSAKKQYRALQEETYSDHAVMPGLINAHTHIGMNFFRGLGSDLPLMDWLNQHMWPAEKKWLSHEFVKDVSLFAMAEMIRCGTTCFNDMYYFLQATAEASEIAGLRAHIGMTILEFPTNWAKTTDEYFEKGLAFYEQYKAHPFIKVTLAPHAPFTLSDSTFIRVQEVAENLDLKINLHVHETMDEVRQSIEKFKKRPIKRLHDLGFLSSRVIAIHMANIDEEDLDVLGLTQPHAVHCPESNMKLASGICPIEKFKSLGMNVALGTDSVGSNNDLDMIGEMRSANFLSKMATMDSLSLKAVDTIPLATLNGAKALSMDYLIGSLEQGKAADFIAVNLNQIETLPLYDPISQVVYSSTRDQVTDVWVAGKQLMKNRQLLTLDEAELKEKARLWGRKIKGEK